MDKLLNITTFTNIFKELIIKNIFRSSKTLCRRSSMEAMNNINGPGEASINVLGSGARGTVNTFYIQTNNSRYLFNCGEGVQRRTSQHSVKLKTFNNIFFTSTKWANIGGLPSICLTFDHTLCTSLRLHAPGAVDMLLKAMPYIYFTKLQIETVKCAPDQGFEDSNIIIKSVYLQPQVGIKSDTVKRTSKLDNPSTLDLARYDNKLGKSDCKKNSEVKSNIFYEGTRKGGGTSELLNGCRETDGSYVAYICKIKKRKGRLDFDKCVERGVVPGPQLHQLSKGLDVEMADGTLLRAQDVCVPDDPEIVVIVVEVPDISYLSESEFAAHFDDGTNPAEAVPAVVVHLTPPDVLRHTKYRKFMSDFGRNTKHLVLNSDNCCLGPAYVRSLQRKLHLLDDKIFPLLGDDCMEECTGDSDLQEAEGSEHLEILKGSTHATYHLRPRWDIDMPTESKLHIDGCVQEVMDDEDFAGRLEKFHRIVAEKRTASQSSDQEYPKVTFLGTAATIAHKAKNTSGIIVQTRHDSSVLLDCGEGTFAQMVRFFGLGRIDAFLRTLKAIYVSHLHTDHYLGLIGVLKGRRGAFRGVSSAAPPVLLVAPQRITDWLTSYDRHFERITPDFTFVPNEALSNPRPALDSSVLSSIGLDDLVTCRVRHSADAFGLALQLPQHKITYSGDTMPCNALIKIGQNSTLLIHEATVDDDKVQENIMKSHSSTSEAIEVGRQMGARHTVLTHFSSRYPVVPRLDEILKERHNVGIAFDHMQVTMSDLELLPHLNELLPLMFPQEYELVGKTFDKRVVKRSYNYCHY